MTALLTHDTINGACTLCIERAERPSLRINEYVSIRCRTGAEFIGQVIEAQINLDQHYANQIDPAYVEQSFKYQGGAVSEAIFRSSYQAYKLELLFLLEGDEARPLVRRPLPGAQVTPLAGDRIAQILRIPNGKNCCFSLAYAPEVQGSINKRIFEHHILVAGSTGSGKTNAIANLILSARKKGACVFVFDHKPDYTTLVTETAVGAVNLFRLGADDKFSYNGQRFREQEIWMPASAFDPVMLAYTLFWQKGEENQAEAFVDVLEIFKSRKMEGEEWSLRDIYHCLNGNEKEKAPFFNGQHKLTMDAIARKVGRHERIPPFVDGKQGIFGGGNSPPLKTLASVCGPGTANVIRLSEHARDSRGYALFLSWIMRQVYTEKTAGNISYPIVYVVDEAGDIFSSSSPHLRNKAVAELDTQIRKGRSRAIGFIIAPQSSDIVPDEIMNNLNTRIVMRHNSGEQAKSALPGVSPGQIQMIQRFSPGEAFVQLYGSLATLHVQFRPSPWELVKLTSAWGDDDE